MGRGNAENYLQIKDFLGVRNSSGVLADGKSLWHVSLHDSDHLMLVLATVQKVGDGLIELVREGDTTH